MALLLITWTVFLGYYSLSSYKFVQAQAITPVPASQGTPSATQSGLIGPGVIKGKLINGTVGATIAPSDSGLVVKLEQITRTQTNSPTAGGTTASSDGNEQLTAQQQSVIGNDGSFTFQNLPVGPAYSYFVSTDYAGATYYSTQPAQLTTAQPTQTLELKVYEATNDPNQVSLTSSSIVVPQIDAQSGQFLVLEMYTFQNKGDRTFVGQNAARSKSQTTPSTLVNTKATTLRFFLPSKASGITPVAGVIPGDLVETSDGVEISSPVLPGDNQFVFNYQMAYEGETFTFSKRLAYDTPSLKFFTPLTGPKATSQSLTLSQPIQMGQQQLAVSSGQDFKANTPIQIELTGLPLPPSRGSVATRDTLLKLGALATLVMGLVFLWLYTRTPKNFGRVGSFKASTVKASGETSPISTASGFEAVEQQQRYLLDKLVSLDKCHKQGELEGQEANYQRERAYWKSQLLEIWPTTELNDKIRPNSFDDSPIETLKETYVNEESFVSLDQVKSLEGDEK